MRILEISPVFPPSVGGLEKCVYEIAKGLARRGHEVVVYTTDFPKSKSKKSIDRVLVRRIPALFSLFHAPVSIFMPYIARENADLVHVHIPPVFGAFSAVIFAKMKGIPLVLTYHNDTVGRNAFENFVARIYNMIQDRFLLGNVQLITVPSAAYVKVLIRRKIDPRIIRVVNNGIDLAGCDKLQKKKEVQEKPGLDRRKLVLYVGALEKRKGVEFLLRAAREIDERSGDVKIVIVGTGSEKKNLEQLAFKLRVDNRVSFKGYVSEEELETLYCESDVFVLPSLYESFGLVLLEAMARGKPVIATRIPGTSELVKAEFNGILVEPKNPKKLGDAIMKVLSDTDYARKLGRNGQIFSASFTWEKAVSDYIHLFSNVLEES
jgi:glycosyltransferase involved in cell wall biosynthesis